MTRARRGRGVAGLLGLVFLAACAHAPHPITLHPAPKATPLGLGAGLEVAVTVTDVRPDPEATDVPSARAARELFPIQGDPVALVLAQALRGLEAQGFRPVAGGGGERFLTLEVRRLDHAVLSGFGSSDVHATAALRAVARRPGATYEVLHQVNERRQVPFSPARQDVEGAVNGALTGVLERVLGDEKLLSFLAGGP